jgi:hypothetical protein
MAFWDATHGIVVGDPLDGKPELLTTSRTLRSMSGAVLFGLRCGRRLRSARSPGLA